MQDTRQLFLMITVLLLALSRGAMADDTVAALSRSSQLPAYLLELPDSVSNILIADVASATMRRFVRSGGNIVEKDRRYMSIGLNGTGKERAWDRKTPLGVYFITEKLDTSKLDDKYGAAAFSLDYPNARDRQKHRTGSGIWLHGVDHKHPDRPPRDTDGCLALPNEEILLLAEVIELLVTPVIVAREIVWATPDELESTRLEFRLMLDIWKDSLARGDLKTYLSLYSDDFQYRKMDKDEWSSYRLGVFEARPLAGVTIDDVMLLADPEEPNLFLSRFTQVLLTDAGPVTTTKRLYWRHGEGGGWEIVAEDSG
ncbi:MAG: L,D-transpeptidase family protein [Proteobacteria bacterium]|nr:L,D-transpeptidase family protein [Pseudomonadota bacterium]